MKIEYLHEGSADCPLIRVYGDDAAAAAELHRAIGRLADGTATQVAAHELPGFQSVGGCALTLEPGNPGARTPPIPLGAGQFQLG
jgi:hypothetical protein